MAWLILSGAGLVSRGGTSNVLYAINLYDNSLAAFDLSTGTNIFVVTNGLDSPYSIALDGSGNLYAANAHNINKFAPDGTDLGVFFSNSNSLSRFFALAFDHSGNLYASCVESTLNNEIHKIGPGGEDLGLFALLNGGSRTGGALAFDGDGNLYASYLGKIYAGLSTIHKFAPDGTDLGVFANVYASLSLAFDRQGVLYAASFADPGGANADAPIQMLGLSGEALGTFNTTDQPWGCTFDDEGKFYVANLLLNEIHRFGADGSDLGVFTTNSLNGPNGLALAHPPPGPILQAQVPAEPGGALMFSWSTNATATSLQESSSLEQNGWSSVTNEPTVVDGRYQLSLTPDGGGNRFYRLASP